MTRCGIREESRMTQILSPSNRRMGLPFNKVRNTVGGLILRRIRSSCEVQKACLDIHERLAVGVWHSAKRP